MLRTCCLLLVVAGTTLTAADPVPASGHSPWFDVLGSLGGLVMGFIQLVLGLGLASFCITKGLQLLSKLLGGISIWDEIKKRNLAVALLAAAVVISYCLVIAGGIASMTSSIIVLGTKPVDGLQALLSGLINLGIAVAVASFAVTVVFKVMDRLTPDIDERAELLAGNTAIGVLYCGVIIGVAGLVASGVGGIGASLTTLFSTLRQALFA